MKKIESNSILLSFVPVIISAVLLCFSTQTTFGNSPQWVTWETSAGGNGHSYLAVPGYPGLTWSIANTLAQQQGGYLASITSQAENNFVFSLINSPQFFNSWDGCGPCIGGYQYDENAEPAGHWAWTSGEPWSYSNWYPGIPDNHPAGQDYLCYLSFIPNTPAATWDDIGGDEVPPYGIALGGYVVEVVPEPNSLTMIGGASLLLIFRFASKRK